MRNNIISKELISEVLGKEIVDFNMLSHPENRTLLAYKPNSEKVGSIINIYELAHKCKEWANSCGIKGKNYQLLTSLFPEYLGGAYCEVWSGAHNQMDANLLANTEYEAIFKACQWILDNKETK